MCDKYDVLTDQDDMIEKQGREIVQLRREVQNQKYLTYLEVVLKEKFKHLYDTSLGDNDDLHKQIEYLKNQFSLNKFNKEAYQNEAAKRNSTDQYIELLENDLNSIYSFL